MRKAVNIITLLFFIWLVLDTFNIPSNFLNFLLIGAIPGTSYALSPNFMLGILAGITIIFISETFVRRYETLKKIRQDLLRGIIRRERSTTI